MEANPINFIKHLRLANKSFWIPFVIDGGESFEHRDYTGLFFKRQPLELTVHTKFFNLILNDEMRGGILIRNILGSLSSERAEIFYGKLKVRLIANVHQANRRNMYIKAKYQYLLEQLEISYKKVKENQNSPYENQKFGKLRWTGENVELFELIDALYLTGKLVAVNKEIVFHFFNSHFILKDESSYDRFQSSITSIRKRKKSKTVFMDLLIREYLLKLDSRDL